MNSTPRPTNSQKNHSMMHNRLLLFAMTLPGLLLPLINHTNGTIVSLGKKRTYMLYVPETYKPDTLTPIVISLHGYSEWPVHQMQISHWNELARQYGFIVVYPCGTGVPLQWHTRIGTGSDADPMMDVTFISDLINKLESDYNLDPACIYVNGLSLGGGMAFILSCKLSEQIAAIGSVSGAYFFPWSECHPSRPVPAIVFHGTKDPIVPYLGIQDKASDSFLPSIPDWVTSLARHNGCTEAPFDLPATGNVSGIQFANRSSNADVVFYTIAGGGHSWPGGGSMPKIIVGNTTRDIDATKTMWDFFCQHPLLKNR